MVMLFSFIYMFYLIAVTAIFVINRKFLHDIKFFAAAFDTDLSNVSVKATTEEKLGFTGSGEGIAAHAVCILVRQ